MLNLILTYVIVMTFGVSYRENKGWVYGKQSHMKRPDMQINSTGQRLYDSETHRQTETTTMKVSTKKHS